MTSELAVASGVENTTEGDQTVTSKRVRIVTTDRPDKNAHFDMQGLSVGKSVAWTVVKPREFEKMAYDLASKIAEITKIEGLKALPEFMPYVHVSFNEPKSGKKWTIEEKVSIDGKKRTVLVLYLRNITTISELSAVMFGGITLLWLAGRDRRTFDSMGRVRSIANEYTKQLGLGAYTRGGNASDYGDFIWMNGAEFEEASGDFNQGKMMMQNAVEMLPEFGKLWTAWQSVKFAKPDNSGGLTENQKKAKKIEAQRSKVVIEGVTYYLTNNADQKLATGEAARRLMVAVMAYNTGKPVHDQIKLEVPTKS